MGDPQASPRDDARFIRRVLIIGALAVLGFVLVRVMEVVLLAFGAVLAAIILHALAEPIRRLTGLGRNLSLGAAVAVMALAVGLASWLFGSEIARQFASLSVTLPAAWTQIQERLSQSVLGLRILDELRSLDGRAGWLISLAPRLASSFASAVTSLVIVIAAGLFLAFKPGYYLDGVLRLVPIPRRPRARVVLTACGVALRQWLIAVCGSMLLVGVCVGIGTTVAGVRSPLALGVLAGLGQFVPVVGPFVAAAPGVLLALADSPEKALWAVLIYVGVGQFESNVFSPLMLRQTAQMPMAMSLFAVLAFGILLGTLGVLFATPLAVVLYVLVRMLYVEDVLGDRSDAPEGGVSG